MIKNFLIAWNALFTQLFDQVRTKLLTESGIPYCLSKGAVLQACTAPAATFTAPVQSSAAAGAETLLTSAGVHGLTAAAAVNRYISISAGTGWTPGLYRITAIAVDTVGTTIQIAAAYDGARGNPTVGLVNQDLYLLRVALPALQANSALDFDLSFSYTNSANLKTCIAGIGTTAFWNPTATTTATLVPSNVLIQNRNSTSSQVSKCAATLGAGNGASTGALATGAENTGTAGNLAIVYGRLALANEYIGIERHMIKLFL